MPGLFGGCCTNAAALVSLEEEFEKAVGRCVMCRAPGLLLGTHGFAHDQPTWRISDSLTAAVDGDHSWYMPSFQRDEASEAIVTAATKGRPVVLKKAGNIAVANADDMPGPRRIGACKLSPEVDRGGEGAEQHRG